MRAVFILLFAGFLNVSALAQDGWTTAQQERATELFYQIRCPVCDSQPIAESDASQSADMRNFVIAHIKKGQTDEQILDALSKSYGDHIRLTPRKELRTLPLWYAPWAFLVIGAVFLFWRSRRKYHTEQHDAA